MNLELVFRYNIIGFLVMILVKIFYDEILIEINFFEEYKCNFILILKLLICCDLFWNKLIILLDLLKLRNISFLKIKVYDVIFLFCLRSFLNIIVFLRSVIRSSIFSYYRSDKLREDGGVSFGSGKIVIIIKVVFLEFCEIEFLLRVLKVNSSNMSFFLNFNFFIFLIFVIMICDDLFVCGMSVGKFLNFLNDRNYIGVE